MEIHWTQLFVTLFCIGILGSIPYQKKAYSIWKKDGTKALFSKLSQFLKRIVCYLKKSPPPPDKTIQELLDEKFFNIRPIHTLKINDDRYRLNVITDSLEKNSYFGGVATSLILATLFSNKFDIPLRIIARFSDANPKHYFSFLELMKISKPKKIEMFSDYESHQKTKNKHSALKLEVSNKDIFLSTSWWSSEVVKLINHRKNFFYILQEVESFFYPNGDEQCICETILKDPNIHYIINTKLLREYYEKNNYSHVSKRSHTFEPAFPEHIYYPDHHAFQKKDKKVLFFYARPNNHRNLFYSGLKILDEAISSGLIGKDWDICFAGNSEIPSFKFSNGLKPKILGQLDWKKYLEFIKTVDLGLAFMQTPHPSYTPLDIASSGGVVLTNTYSNKCSLPYSQNIICANTDPKSLLEGLEQALQLSMDTEKRRANFLNNRIERNWETSLENVLNYMYEHK